MTLGLGLHPFAAFAVVGFGAAAYAPAKYGLVTELGGLLVSPWLLGLSGFIGFSAAQQALQAMDWLTPNRLSLSIALLLLVYGLAALLNLGVPDSGARYPTSGLHPRRLCRDFWQANRRLWADADGGLS